MAFASDNRPETIQRLANWLKVDREVAGRRYDLGKTRWSAGGVVSDSAVKLLVDQSLAELQSKETIPLERVRNWTFAEHTRRELGGSKTAR